MDENKMSNVIFINKKKTSFNFKAIARQKKSYLFKRYDVVPEHMETHT
jgi:hypothetical protein